MSKTNYDLSQIKAFVFDVDGVLSPSTVPVYRDGEPCRMMNVKDGYALQLAIKLGYKVAIITGAKSELIKKRYELLGVEEIFIGVENKIDVYETWAATNQLPHAAIAYMGDDIPDYEVMQMVGWACCPADAAIDIQRIARYISPYKGGEGCVRDVIEQTLRAQGVWMNNEHTYKW